MPNGTECRPGLACKWPTKPECGPIRCSIRKHLEEAGFVLTATVNDTWGFQKDDCIIVTTNGKATIVEKISDDAPPAKSPPISQSHLMLELRRRGYVK